MPTPRQILIVDDEPSIRQVIGRYFSAHGFTVREAYDCASAEEAFRIVPPDVALIDFRLPDGDGVELIRTCGRWIRRPPWWS